MTTRQYSTAQMIDQLPCSTLACYDLASSFCSLPRSPYPLPLTPVLFQPLIRNGLLAITPVAPSLARSPSLASSSMQTQYESSGLMYSKVRGISLYNKTNKKSKNKGFPAIPICASQFLNGPYEDSSAFQLSGILNNLLLRPARQGAL